MQVTAGKLYRGFVVRHWPLYVLGTLTIVVTAGAEVLAPKFSQWCLDIIIYRGASANVPIWLQNLEPTAALFRAITVLCGVFSIGILGRWGWRQTLARLTHMAGHDIKISFWDTLRHLPLRTFHSHTLGDLMSRATADWNTSRTIYGFTLVTTYDLILCTGFALISMWLINWQLTVLCLCVWPVLPTLVFRLARREHDEHLAAQESLGHLSESISQSLASIRLQRTTASEERWRHELNGFAEEYSRRRLQVLKTGWKIFPVGASPALFAYAILFFAGIRKIQTHDISIGGFVAMQSYVLFLQGPLLELGNIIAEWQRGIGSLKRVAEVFNLRKGGATPTATAYAAKITPGHHLVAIKNLSFQYEPDGEPILKNVTLEIPRGGTLGLHGPVGSGKTTLLKLIAGIETAPRGTVFLDGADAHDLTRKTLQALATMVPQKSFLFAGDIRQNLLLDGDFSDFELWRVLEIVALQDEIRAFSDGLNTKIGEWGTTLSGGQKQRLTLARALLRPRPLLLLDDCLSAVDVKTEERILAGLRAHFREQTIVWVAHRMTTLQLCGEVYSLEKGVARKEVLPC